MRDTKDILDFDIYPHLDRAEAVKHLNPQGNLYFHKERLTAIERRTLCKFVLGRKREDVKT
jgi:hypothetical protein